MKHTLIAELHALKSGSVYVKAFCGQKEPIDSLSKECRTLPEAEEYAFSLGAESIASVQNQPGILRATRVRKGKRTYTVTYEGVILTRTTARTYHYAVVCWRNHGRDAELKCSESYQGAYKMQCQWQNWYGSNSCSPILTLTQPEA